MPWMPTKTPTLLPQSSPAAHNTALALHLAFVPLEPHFHFPCDLPSRHQADEMYSRISIARTKVTRQVLAIKSKKQAETN